MTELIVMLKDVMSFSAKKSIVIDSWEFKISNQITPIMLILCSMIVTARQFFGHPIKCDSGHASIVFTNNYVTINHVQLKIIYKFRIRIIQKVSTSEVSSFLIYLFIIFKVSNNIVFWHYGTFNYLQ